MPIVKTFAALRPAPTLAAQICELPYDVLSSAEARSIASEKPLSFFHVSKPEVDLAPESRLSDPSVYAQGQASFQRLIRERALLQDPRAHFYLYRQVMGKHSQTGLVAVASCDEYSRNIIKRHELTRPDKEDDRVRHIQSLNAQTGPAFLVYQSDPVLDEVWQPVQALAPEVDFTAPDGVRHTSWTIADPGSEQLIRTRFAQLSALYIADGHHRTAAAARVAQERKGAGMSGFFLSVIFPHNQVQILPYNRVLKHLNGATSAGLLKRLETVCSLVKTGRSQPLNRHELALYLDHSWYSLNFRPPLTEVGDPIEQLDVTLLQKHVLAPLFGIDDPRRSEQINFVGGIRGSAELERLVDSGQYACAFAMFPTSIQDLMAVADSGGLMPPKSTWFEPKLRDGMFCHLLDPRG